MNASAAGVVRASEPARACVASAPSITRVVVGPQCQCCVADAESHPLFWESTYGFSFAFAGACQCPTTKHCRLRWGCHLGSLQLLGPDCYQALPGCIASGGPGCAWLSALSGWCQRGHLLTVGNTHCSIIVYYLLRCCIGIHGPPMRLGARHTRLRQHWLAPGPALSGVR